MEDYHHPAITAAAAATNTTVTAPPAATTSAVAQAPSSPGESRLAAETETTSSTGATTSMPTINFQKPSVPAVTVPNSILRRPQPLANSTTLNARTLDTPQPSSVAGSSNSNGTNHITNKNSRAAVNNKLFNVSGIAKLRDTPASKIQPSSHTNNNNNNNENSYDEEDDENVDDQNVHTETTMNDLDALKLSTINSHGDTNGRMTRSTRLGAKGYIIFVLIPTLAPFELIK